MGDYPAVETIIPYGSGYDKPRAVFRGPNADVKANVAEYFGIEADATLVSTVIKAALTAHDLVAQHLQGPTKATPVQEPPAEPAAPAEDKPKRSGAGRKSAAFKTIEGNIAEAKDLEALRNVWRNESPTQTWQDNKAHFEGLVNDVRTKIEGGK
jgi:hypothetical protein